jgi:hypothetical protein
MDGGSKMKVFNTKEYFPEAYAIYYTGPLDFTEVHFSKELINRMIVIGDRQESPLKKLLLSEADMKDVAHYSNQVPTDVELENFLDEAGAPKWGLGLEVDARLEGSGVVIGLTEKEGVIIVGETGRCC